MREDGFRTLRVSLSTANTTTARGTHRHGRGEFTRRAIPQPRKLTHHLVETGINVVSELNLGDGLQPIDAHSNGRRNDSTLGNRRIQHAVHTVLALQSVGHTEDTTKVTNVLTKDDHTRVTLEHDVHG